MSIEGSMDMDGYRKDYVMDQYSFSIPQNIKYGINSLLSIPDTFKEKSLERVLIISDRILEELGFVQKVSSILRDANIEVACYLDVEPNPSIETVQAAVEIYKSFEAEGIVALGGGSPMDVAKSVGVLAAYGGEIVDYEGAHKVPGPIVPLVAIPTTAGTGSEVTAFSVITDKKRNYKLTVFSYELIPTCAILDPAMIMSLPAGVAASTGMDALVHAVEAYLSLAASPFTNAMAQKAIELIGTNIRSFVANRKDEDAASAMMSASTFAGIAFAWARLGNVHAMAHPLGGFYNVAHGVANAILLPVVLEYNALADKGKYEKIYECLTGKRTQSFESRMLVEAIKKLNADLNIPATLTQVGVDDKKIVEMAEDAMKSGNILVNPRQSTLEDIIELYHQAL